jgi:hypothetical protein
MVACIKQYLSDSILLSMGQLIRAKKDKKDKNNQGCQIFISTTNPNGKNIPKWL